MHFRQRVTSAHMIGHRDLTLLKIIYTVRWCLFDVSYHFRCSPDAIISRHAATTNNIADTERNEKYVPLTIILNFYVPLYRQVYNLFGVPVRCKHIIKRRGRHEG